MGAVEGLSLDGRIPLSAERRVSVMFSERRERRAHPEVHENDARAARQVEADRSSLDPDEQ